MAIREKLKRAFKTNSPASSKVSSPVIPPPTPDYTRWPSNVYRPDEPMPRPKYRAPVKKEHKEKLESFAFGSSWRRRSRQSMQSPMGSRLSSRRGSKVSRKSFSGQSASGMGRESVDLCRKSVGNGSSSRSNSITASSIQPATDRQRIRHSLRVANAKQSALVEADHSPKAGSMEAQGGLPRLQDESEDDASPSPTTTIKPATALGMPISRPLPQPPGSQQVPGLEPKFYFPFTTTATALQLHAAPPARTTSNVSYLSGRGEDMLSDGDYADYYASYHSSIDDVVVGGRGGDAAQPPPSEAALPRPQQPRKTDSGTSSKLLGRDLMEQSATAVDAARGPDAAALLAASEAADEVLVGAMARSRVGTGRALSGPGLSHGLRRTSSGVLPAYSPARVAAVPA